MAYLRTVGRVETVFRYQFEPCDVGTVTWISDALATSVTRNIAVIDQPGRRERAGPSVMTTMAAFGVKNPTKLSLTTSLARLRQYLFNNG